MGEGVNQYNVCPLNRPRPSRSYSVFILWLEYGSQAHLAPRCCTPSVPLRLSSELCRKISRRVLAELCRFSASCSRSAGRPRDCPPVVTKKSGEKLRSRKFLFPRRGTATHTHSVIVLGPGDCRRRDPKGVTAKSERLLQGDSEVQLLAVILDLRGN